MHAPPKARPIADRWPDALFQGPKQAATATLA
jgi:hypothetical protein